MTQVTLKHNHKAKTGSLYMAFDLSHKSWKIAFGDGHKTRIVSVEGKNLEQLNEAIRQARIKLGLSDDCPVYSCYEAGRDGFWLHRYLIDAGIHNQIVDSSSIEMNRRKRQAKTDRVDARKLLGMLVRQWVGGETRHWSIVQVPDVEAEDLRRLQREIDRLIKEKGQHSTRLRSLLNLEGIVVDKVGGDGWEAMVNDCRCYDGRPLAANLRQALLYENQRRQLAHQQILALEAEKRRLLEEELEQCSALQKVQRLMNLRGIGKASSWLFVLEFFGWRQFNNRKELASLAGLTPTPSSSGDGQREQGISKAGNRRLRTMMIEIAWLWLRYQPQSKLSQWYQERFGGHGKRLRRIGIVALARKLLILLWRYVETGELPKDIVLQA